MSSMCVVRVVIEKSNLGGHILDAQVEFGQPNVAILTLGRAGLNHGIAPNGLNGDGSTQISEGMNDIETS